jgi:hypothetical protein
MSLFHQVVSRGEGNRPFRISFESWSSSFVLLCLTRWGVSCNFKPSMRFLILLSSFVSVRIGGTTGGSCGSNAFRSEASRLCLRASFSSNLSFRRVNKVWRYSPVNPKGLMTEPVSQDARGMSRRIAVVLIATIIFSLGVAAPETDKPDSRYPTLVAH